MRHGDTAEQHKRKVEQKIRELRQRGFSEKAIKSILSGRAMFTRWANESR